MLEVGWYLKRIAVPLFLGAPLSLVLAFALWNRGGAVWLAGAAVVVSLLIATLILLKSPHYPRWSVITSGGLVMMAVAISAIFTRGTFQWVVNFPAWGIGPVYWALLRECRKDESGINLLSWTIFITIDLIVVGLLIGAIA
ncbi:MAG: hypothetical protein WCD76_15375 [Pyrinomonadaceae bacterium]